MWDILKPFGNRVTRVLAEALTVSLGVILLLVTSAQMLQTIAAGLVTAGVTSLFFELILKREEHFELLKKLNIVFGTNQATQPRSFVREFKSRSTSSNRRSQSAGSRSTQTLSRMARSARAFTGTFRILHISEPTTE
jgi:hypothetical protein